jgi:hypothetical protein
MIAPSPSSDSSRYVIDFYICIHLNKAADWQESTRESDSNFPNKSIEWKMLLSWSRASQRHASDTAGCFRSVASFSATVRPFPAKGSVRRSVSTGLSEVEYQSEGYGPITDDTKNIGQRFHRRRAQLKFDRGKRYVALQFQSTFRVISIARKLLSVTGRE